MIRRVSVLCTIFCLFCSVCSAEYWGHLRSYLGEDYDYTFKQIGMFTYLWNEKHPNKQYLLNLDSVDGQQEIRLSYRGDNQFIVEFLLFNDEDMAYRYTTIRRFNDYNDLIAEAKKAESNLRLMGIVHYDKSGLTYASDWQYTEFYKIDDYDLSIVTQYTPRGKYKASLNLIDKKFDRIKNGYY